MAAYHHHCLCRNPPAAAVCCGGSAHPTTPQPAPQHATSDPLLHALAAHLLHATQPPPQPSAVYRHLSSYKRPQNNRIRQDGYHDPDPQTVDSLLRRITALEASLRHLSSSPPPRPLPSPPSPTSLVCSHRRRSRSLRDLAARTIQIHFRAFLVRRSRTLRQLKDLAFIKSRLNALKSSASDPTRFDPDSLSRKAMDLLRSLDSVQDGDPMIRDGKRSISVQLVGFLEFIDGVLVKRRQMSARSVKNNTKLAKKTTKNGVFTGRLSGTGKVGMGFSRFCEYGDEDDVEELLRFHPAAVDEQYPSVFGQGKLGFGHVRNNGFSRNMQGNQSRVPLSVNFADNANLSQVLYGANQLFSNRDVCVEDEEEVAKDHYKEEAQEESGSLSRGTEKEEEEEEGDADADEANLENGGSATDSDGDKNHGRMNLSSKRSDNVFGGRHYQDDDFLFSAPIPVKMESRTDLMNKRKCLKIME